MKPLHNKPIQIIQFSEMKNVVDAMATALEDFKYNYGYRVMPASTWDLT